MFGFMGSLFFERCQVDKVMAWACVKLKTASHRCFADSNNNNSKFKYKLPWHQAPQEMFGTTLD